MNDHSVRSSGASLEGDGEADISALVDRLLLLFNARKTVILAQHVLPTTPAVTLTHLGVVFGVSRERVRQLANKIRKKLLLELPRPVYAPLRQCGVDIRADMGAAVPCDDPVLAALLHRMTAAVAAADAAMVRSLLLWLAGPYRAVRGWLLVEPECAEQTRLGIARRVDDAGWISASRVRTILRSQGVSRRLQGAWLDHVGGCLVVPGGYLVPRGNSLDMVHQLLRVYRRPMLAEELLPLLPCKSVRSLRNRMLADQRFWRVDVHGHFVLSGSAGFVPFNGIAKAIKREIEAGGGQTTRAWLRQELPRRYGVKPASILPFVHAAMFTVDADTNVLRLRDLEHGAHRASDIRTAAQCYAQDDGTWVYCLRVNGELARGSGRPLPNAFAEHMGCTPGNLIKLLTERGDEFTISWPATSSMGAQVGSLKNTIEGLDMAPGDYLFVGSTIPVTLRPLYVKDLRLVRAPVRQLCLLVGRQPATAKYDNMVQIAHALGVAGNGAGGQTLGALLERSLLGRGEDRLAALLTAPSEES